MNEDANLAWLRQQVDEAMHHARPHTTRDRVELFAVLVTGLAFFGLLIGLALTAPL
jgi:hypothetical protein